MVGFEGDDPEEEDIVVLDGEEDALTLFNGIISDVFKGQKVWVDLCMYLAFVVNAMGSWTLLMGNQ